MESLWGADAAEFKPERWLEEGKVFSPYIVFLLKFVNRVLEENTSVPVLSVPCRPSPVFRDEYGFLGSKISHRLALATL